MAGKKTRRLKIIEVILTVLGTATVFATFYVHEVKQEKLKELKNDVQRAQEQSAMHVQINDALLGIMEGVIAPQRRQPDIRSDEFIWRGIENNVQLRLMIEERLRVSTTVFYSIASSLETPEIYKAQLYPLVERLMALDKEEAAILNDIQVARISTKRNRREFPRSVDSIGRHDQKTQEEVENLRKNFDAAIQKLLMVSTRVEHESRQSYERYTKLSYVLFPLGFLIGLAGKLLGIEETTEE